MNTFSLDSLKRKWMEVGKRFPASIAFAACFAITLIVMVANDGQIVNDQITFFLAFYFGTGLFLTIGAKLWSEEEADNRKKKRVFLVLFTLWPLVALYFASLIPFDMVSGVGCLSFMLLFVISLFLVSFIGEKNDVPLWHFFRQVAGAVVASVVSSAVLWGGVSLILLSLEKLFGIAVTSNAYAYAGIVCMAFLAPLLFMQLLPSETGKHCTDTRLTSFAEGVMSYLFLPLLAVYLLTLYVYAGKILLTWQLPNGWVSWLVTALMAGLVAVTLILYPQQFNEGKQFHKQAMRWLPILTLPLLLLMTIGIARRLGDYGITVRRLYLLAFNLWCYAVCLYLIIGKHRRMAWIPLSFGIAFFVLSIGPWSIGNYTRQSLKKSVARSMSGAGFTHLPLSQADYERWISGLGQKEATRQNSRLLYLRQNFEQTETAGLLSDRVSLFRMDESDDTLSLIPVLNVSAGKLLSQPTPLPSDYTRLMMIDDEFSVDRSEAGKDSFPITLSTPDKAQTFTFRIDNETIRMLKEDSTVRPVVLRADSTLFYIDTFELSSYSDQQCLYSIRGVVFLK